MTFLKGKLTLVFCLFFTSIFSQTFNWTAFPTNTVSWVASPTFSVTKATAGGGSFDVRSSSAAGNSPISATTGDVAQNCGTYTGLRLEMSGAGNGAGTAVWNNSVTVTLNFPTNLCAPVTFNIYDVTETFYTGGPNYVYYQDKVIISALDNASNPVTPGATSVGGIDNTVVGNTRVLVANGTTAQCMNQAITVGSVGQQIKQITITYCNQDLPTHCPAPVGSPPRYGISQYQYIFISPITGAPAPTASITSPTLACGVTSSTLTATTSAGSPTYSWAGPGGSTVSSPSSSATAVSGAGVYTVTINPGGCSTTATYNIGSGGTPPSVTATAPTTLNCTTTTVQAIASTTSTPVTYNWTGPSVTGGASTASASVNAPGTYNYTVTNTSTGCSTTGTVAVSQNTSVVTASTSATSSLNCTTTTAQIIATTTASPVSYVWSGTGITGGAGTATINVNQGGSFNYTITNTSNGCKTVGTQSVTQNTVVPSPTATSPSSITCATNTVALNGGPAALTYTWSGPGFSGGTNSQNATATAAGSYTLAVTGANGCTNTAVTTVGTNTALPSPTATSPNSITCTTNTVALNGGPAALTYTWSGAGFSGGTNSQNAVATAAGTYTLAVTGANGCTNTAVTTVGSNTTSPVATASLATAITCTSTSATLQGGPLAGVTYSWSGVGLTGATNQATASITAPGTYTLLTTSTVNGCTNTAVVTPTANLTPPQVNVVPDLTINCVTPTALLEGSSSTPGVTYAWTGPTVGNPAGTTPTSSTSVVNAAGNYTLTVTNPVNGCTSTAALAVTSNVALPSITVGSSQTVTCTSPSAVLTGSSTTSPVNYSWTGPAVGNPAGSTPTNSNTTVNAGGNYTLTITNPINSCTNTAVVSITQNTTPPSITATNTSTLTCSTLTANITGTGGGSYNWSGPGITSGATSSNATVNLPGTYTLLVTAANGCTATANTSITQNTTAPTANASNATTLSCLTLTANVTGTGGGNYNWSGPGIVSGGTTSTPVVNQGGTYNLTVTAANGCTATASTAITQNTTAPTITATNTSTLTCTTLTANLTGTGGGSYNWSGPGITAGGATTTPTVNLPGTYNLTVTAANGCTATANTTITQNTITPSVSTATSGVLNCTLTTVTAAATTTTSPVSYNWAGAGITAGGATSTPTINVGGTYSYTVTNTNNGCKTTGSVAVTQNTTAPSASATGGTLTCANTSTTLVGGPVSGVNYSWTGAGLSGATNLANATATTIGSYTLVTTSTTNGCTNTAVATVTNNTVTPTANAGSTQTLVCGVSSVTLTGSGTPLGSTANWLGGVTSPTSFTTTVGAPGTYTLVVTHPTSGCTSTSTVAVSSSTDVPQATVNAITNSITCTNSVVAIGVTLSNTDPVSYTWTGSGIAGTNNTASTTATVAGTYSVTITNTVSNCQSVFNVVVPTNTNNPVTTANSSNTITCSTTSITVSATPTGTNYGYAWSGPGTITNGTTANPGVNVGGTYTVTITDNVNGCIGTGTVNVATNTVSPTMTLTPSSLTTTCANPTATLLATSSADPDVNYVWTAPSTGSLNNTTINNPVANGSGVFTVQVTNTVSGCVSATETVTITADANVPTLNATSSNTAICSNQTVTLSITGADTYTWSTTENTSTIAVTPATTTTYSVSGTNTLTGCSNITNVTVSVTPTPTLNVSASATTICEGNTTTLTLTGATSYTVTNPSQTTTGTITLSPTAQTTYTIVGDASGCATTTETITINVNALPQVLTTNTTTCAGTAVTLSATGADTYNWQPTGATTNTTTVSPTTNTTYTVTGTNTVTGCTSTITTADVTVNQLPNITASANPNTTCTSGTVNLNAATTGTAAITNYTWTLGNGVDNTNQNQGSITFPANGLTTGTYTYTVVATDVNGCVSLQATTTLDIIDTPNANFDLSDLSICQNENGAISINTPQTGVTYDWNINGQAINNANPLTVPSSITSAAGTYTVNLIAGIGTCTNTAANTLTVNALPTVALVNSITSACVNTSAQLDVAGPNSAYTYNWTNGSNTATGPNLNVNPLTQATAGSYTVTATDVNGCVNRTIGAIDAQECITEVPEIFTPNGDGKNDGFVIKNIENFPDNKLKIFNRWGNLVYEKNGYLNEFEGFANTGDQVGKSKLPSGTYYVVLEYGDQKTETYNGILVLQY